jgi:flagellar hook-associated protein 1 FlgK
MTSIYGLLDIASSGLAAQSAALDITGQNVANANTPGYVKRSVTIGDTTGNGQVVVLGATRSINAFAQASVLAQQSLSGAADGRSSALAQLEAIVAPTGGTVGDAVNAFFSSIQTLAATPADPSARAAVLNQATNLAQSISTTASGIAATQQGELASAQGLAQQVSDDLSQIATLNGQIATATAQGSSAADLRDQRDVLVGKVATATGARTIEDASGRVTLFGAGTALVSGDSASSLSVGLDASGALKITATRSDGSSVDVTSQTTQGQLGGIREARDVDAAKAASSLDQLAYNLSNAVNTAHAAGFALDGSSGHPLFTQPTGVAGAAYAMAVDPSMAGHPELIAAASSAADAPGGNGNLSALAAVGSNPLLNGQPPADAFATIASTVGSAKSSAEAEQTLRGDTLAQAQTLEQSADGVSVDEEMANLTRYQNAYEASTKVLQTVSTLLNNFMTVLG